MKQQEEFTVVPDRITEEERVKQLVAVGRALSDPIRVKMLGIMAAATVAGRGCCDLPDLGVPADAEEKELGVCACEFEDYFGVGQSKVSYHVRKLKEAGLIQEEKRGKWSFYSLNKDAAQQLLSEVAAQLGTRPPLVELTTKGGEYS